MSHRLDWARPWRVAGRHPLLTLSVALVGLRLLLLVTGPESVLFAEELYRGTVAKELIDGLKLPFASYRPDPYSGGFFVVSLLAAPLFVLLGPTLVALKLVPLAFALGSLVLLFAGLDRYVGRRAALLGGWLFVLSPPTFAQLSLVAMGFHTEAVLPSLLILLAWYRVVDRPTHAPRLVLFGLAVGAGVSFTYGTALAGVACLASGLVARPRPGPRAMAWMSLGLALGLLPCVVDDATHGFEGLRWVLALLGPQLARLAGSPLAGLTALARKAGGAVLIGIPQSCGFPSPSGIPGVALSYAYWGLAAVGIALRRPLVTARTRPLLLYGVLFVLAFALTGYDVPRHGEGIGFFNFRFFALLHVVALILVARAAAGTRAGVAVAAVLVAAGGLGQAALLSREVAPHVLAYRGYSYFELGVAWATRLYPGSQTFVEAAPVLARFPEPVRRFVYWGMLDNVTSRPCRPRPLLARLDEVPPPSRIDFAGILGAELGACAGAGLAEIVPMAARLGERERPHFYRGYALSVARPGHAPWAAPLDFEGQPPEFRRWLDLSMGALLESVCNEDPPDATCVAGRSWTAGLDDERRAWVYRGIGTGAAQNLLAGLRLDAERILRDPLPPARRYDVFWGIGWGLREALREDRLWAVGWIGRLPSDGRVAALDGLTACEAFFRLDAALAP